MEDSFSSPEDQADRLQSAGHINLLLCTNALFLQHAAVCLASVLANTPELFFDVVVVSQPDESLDEAKLQRSVDRFPNQSLSFRKFAIPKDILLPLNPLAHYTLDTYSRLWIGEFFPADVERVLYLDVDMVVAGSVAPLWSIDLNGALMAAVDIPGSMRGVDRLALRPEDGYFNAGMLVIDLKQWRETAAGQQVLEYIQENPERVLYDQDALNAVFHHRTKRLPFEWNAIRPFYDEPTELPLAQIELEKIRRDAIIIHFNGNLKPWSYFCDHPRRNEYTKYLRMTEWRDFVPPDRTTVNMIRKLVSRVLPPRVKSTLKTGLAQLPGVRRAADAA